MGELSVKIKYCTNMWIVLAIFCVMYAIIMYFYRKENLLMVNMFGLVLLMIYVTYYFKKVKVDKSFEYNELYDVKYKIEPTEEDPNPNPAFKTIHYTEYKML